jgi:2-polyprenyl-3-methyl-5-hydroxy-6-metoxy-1,4-benzoquinol methylase
MGLFRITHTNFEEIFSQKDFDTTHDSEWSDCSRVLDPTWNQRYEYEANVVTSILEEYPHIKTVLELGSGPGVLSQKIQERHSNLEYHLVDKPFAEKYFSDNSFKGKFFVKDMSSKFDTDGLLNNYDLVITNDFLEHVFNPHEIVSKICQLTNENSIYLISNPNWRMAHQFIYRGLFDFDNLLYFMYVHGFETIGLYGSILKTPRYPRLSSETLLPEEHLYDWNHYIIFKKRSN